MIIIGINWTIDEDWKKKSVGHVISETRKFTKKIIIIKLFDDLVYWKWFHWCDHPTFHYIHFSEYAITPHLTTLYHDETAGLAKTVATFYSKSLAMKWKVTTSKRIRLVTKKTLFQRKSSKIDLNLPITHTDASRYPFVFSKEKKLPSATNITNQKRQIIIVSNEAVTAVDCVVQGGASFFPKFRVTWTTVVQHMILSPEKVHPQMRWSSETGYLEDCFISSGCGEFYFDAMVVVYLGWVEDMKIDVHPWC